MSDGLSPKIIISPIAPTVSRNEIRNIGIQMIVTFAYDRGKKAVISVQLQFKWKQLEIYGKIHIRNYYYQLPWGVEEFRRVFAVPLPTNIQHIHEIDVKCIFSRQFHSMQKLTKKKTVWKASKSISYMGPRLQPTSTGQAAVSNGTTMLGAQHSSN